MKNIDIIITTLFSKKDRLRKMLEDLSIQSRNVSEVIITFQRTKSNYYEECQIKDFLKRFDGLNIVYELVDEIGISSGRNRALSKAKADWMLISDDDCRYQPGSIEKVVRAVEGYSDSDAITFQSDRYPKKKSFKNRVFKHSLSSIKGVSSIEIAFNEKVRDFLGAKPFDENFGLGSKWPTGEEQIFLSDIIKNGGRVMYIPEVIVTHEEESSGHALGPEVVKAKGAMFRRTHGYWGMVFAILFVFKKAFVGNLKLGVFKGLGLVMAGFNEFNKN